jgi:hypothetical protein
MTAKRTITKLQALTNVSSFAVAAMKCPTLSLRIACNADLPYRNMHMQAHLLRKSIFNFALPHIFSRSPGYSAWRPAVLVSPGYFI